MAGAEGGWNSSAVRQPAPSVTKRELKHRVTRAMSSLYAAKFNESKSVKNKKTAAGARCGW
jgi:hypothetical protein